MLKTARNTLASIEESADRAATATVDSLVELSPVIRDMALEVHRTCIRLQRAADEHTRTARFVSEMIESIVWGAAAGLALYYAREIVKSVWDLSHE
jgi:hypothetical protein